ncbi:hypothetical protein K435DRAFT_766436 [Dendrothele bispora CBS 962.96]|uniref:DUF6987 domain-containing protein n=1 Tax=Dendrothele bispora (strain CBS 962.96) TaxID=1314807 RepID=A0A4S8L3P4_DENBC|nr:hypothetical protein K435DRAFT_766436 [Dendrothele bispora CBS 962.96]
MTDVHPPPPPRATSDNIDLGGTNLGHNTSGGGGDRNPRGQEQGFENLGQGLGQGLGLAPASLGGSSTENGDQRTEEEKKKDAELADRLSRLIEDANERVVPLCRMIRKHIESMESRPEEERNEQELIDAVRPLLIQSEKILNETLGSVKGADPDNRLTNKARRHAQTHRATPEEQRLAAALKVLMEEVGGTIEWARDKLDSYPKAKRDLGPLLDALGQPLTQIVAGIGMLLAGVLNLLSNLLSGLGLDSLLKGIVGAIGLDKIADGLGLGKFFVGGGDKKK